MQEGGFDCILGNPPFLGGKSISGQFGDDMLNYLKNSFIPAEGGVDLVGYFFRRDFDIIGKNGFLSLISTNTISQGDTRLAGLEIILSNSGIINFAVRSIKWPGVANVQVSLISIHNGQWDKKCFLGSKEVQTISSYLDDHTLLGNPKKLFSNLKQIFQGSVLLGSGFILGNDTAQKIIKSNEKYKKVLFPFLSGQDLNGNPDQKSPRWVINFYTWTREYCEENFEECYKIVEQNVKPQREKVKRKIYREKWWLFAEKAVELYKEIEELNKAIAIPCQASKYPLFSFVNTRIVYSSSIAVLASYTYRKFLMLNSSIHSEWCWKYASTMRHDIRYSPSDLYETFPFPQNLTKETEAELEKIGEEYHEFRRQLMLDMQLGLTKTYNLFHNPQCSMDYVQSAMDIRELKTAKLQIPIEEAIQRIEKLRALHKQMDEAVLKAYTWSEQSGDPDSSGTAINLAHNFYDVDYLPENDRKRYTISPDARKEILKRLLELNHKIHAEEVAKGLWDKKGKGKKKEKSPLLKEQEEKYGQDNLFKDA